MFGLPILDIAIGLILIYLILALTCTAINELIAGAFDRRSKNLFSGLQNLLSDPTVKLPAGDGATQDLLTSFYSHPLIKALEENGKSPSYIPSRTFALTLLDLVSPADPKGSKTITDLRAAIGRLDVNSPLRKTLLVMIDDAGDDLKKIQANIEIWFNNSMDRVAAWYKTRTQTIIVIIAVVVVGATNADTIRIGKALSNDQALRDALVAQAQEYAKATPPPVTSETPKPPEVKINEIKENVTALQTLGVPLGYEDEKWSSDPGWLLSKILGLLLTVGAASLGAPFWFDMLNKFINVRSAGKSPDEVAKPPEAQPKRPEETPPK